MQQPLFLASKRSVHKLDVNKLFQREYLASVRSVHFVINHISALLQAERKSSVSKLARQADRRP